MSSEECSLAFDEEIELNHYEPELSIFVNLRYENKESSFAEQAEDVVRVCGRMTISF